MPINQAQKRLAIALRYASNGWLIYPTKADSKFEFSREYSPSACRDAATVDPVKIRAWAAKYYGCNFKGIPPKGEAVVDIDDLAGFDQLLETDRELPLGTPSTRTTDGYHLRFRTPLKVERGAFWLIPAMIEVLQVAIMLPGSTVEGFTYAELNTDLEPLNAPDWLEAAITAHNHQHTQKLAVYVAPVQLERTSGNVTSRDIQYANAALINNLDNLANARSGSRFETLRAVSLSLGHYVHILGRDTITSSISRAVSGWQDQNKIEKVIEFGISKTENDPKYAPNSPTLEEGEIRGAIAQMLAVSDSIAWRGKFAGSSGNVQALGLRDCLLAILHRAEEVNSLDVIASVRWLAEAANMNKETAGKVLAAMRQTGVIQVSRVAENGKANKYRLTEKGFLKLLELKRLRESPTESPQTGQVLEDEEELRITSFSSSITCPVYGLSDLGIFGHTTLGRASERILELLAIAPMTTVQLEAATGIPHGTIHRALGNLAQFEFIDKGGRNQPHTLNAENLGRAALNAAEVMQTPQRMAHRKTQHALNRDGYRESIKLDNGVPVWLRKRWEHEERQRAEWEAYDADGVWINDPHDVNEPWLEVKVTA